MALTREDLTPELLLALGGEPQLTFEDIMSGAQSAPEDIFIGRGNDVLRGRTSDAEEIMSLLQPLLEKADLSGASYSKMPNNLAERLQAGGQIDPALAGFAASGSFDEANALKKAAILEVLLGKTRDRGEERWKAVQESDTELEKANIAANALVQQAQIGAQGGVEQTSEAGKWKLRELAEILPAQYRVALLEALGQQDVASKQLKGVKYAQDAETDRNRESLTAMLEGKGVDSDTAKYLAGLEGKRTSDTLAAELERAMMEQLGLTERAKMAEEGATGRAKLGEEGADRRQTQSYKQKIIELLTGKELAGEEMASRERMQERQIKSNEKLSAIDYTDALLRLQMAAQRDPSNAQLYAKLAITLMRRMD